MSHRQYVDPKTGRPEIEAAMSWMPPPEPPARKKKHPHGIPKFVPKDAFMKRPGAEELRALNSLRSILSSTRVTSAPAVLAQPTAAVSTVHVTKEPPLPLTAFTPESASKAKARLGAALVGGYGPGFPESGPVTSRSSSSKRTKNDMLRSQDGPTNLLGQPTRVWPQPPSSPDHSTEEIDFITHLPVKKSRPRQPPPTTLGATISSEIRAGCNILGQPIVKPPERPKSAQQQPAAATSLTFDGAEDHYRRLGAAVSSQLRPEMAALQRPRLKGKEDAPLSDPQELDIMGNIKVQPPREALGHRRRKPVDLGGPWASTSSSAPMPPAAALPVYIAAPPPVQVATVHVPTAGVPTVRERPPTASATPMKSSTTRDLPIVRRIFTAALGWGLRPLRLALRSREKKGNGILAFNELKHALSFLGVEAAKSDFEVLRLRSIPPSGLIDEGAVFLPVLLEELRGAHTFNAKRESAVRQAFARALKQCEGYVSDGSIPIDQLVAVFDPTGHVAYQAHDPDSARKIKRGFQVNWGVGSETKITEDVFVAFWKDVAAGVVRDDAFVAMMNTAFGKP